MYTQVACTYLEERCSLLGRSRSCSPCKKASFTLPEPSQGKAAYLKPAKKIYTPQEVPVKRVPGCIANADGGSCLFLAQAPHHSAKTTLTQHSRSAATSSWIPTPAGEGEFLSLTVIAYSPASTSRYAALPPQHKCNWPKSIPVERALSAQTQVACLSACVHQMTSERARKT